PLFPVLFLLAAGLPFGFFLWKAPVDLERHFTTIVSNDPQNGLSQSLAALTNAQGRLQNELYLKALRVASSANVQKALGKPKIKLEDLKWALGDLLDPAPTPLLVISDSKGNALYNNLGLTVSTPSPTPIADKKSKKIHSSKPPTPLYPSIKSWPGFD